MARHATRGPGPGYAATIFLGAVLLFAVQPIISKAILPWFGGSPAVWTTCLLFFQVLLLGGYAYAHALTRWPHWRQQLAVHLALIVLAIATLPITPGAFWKPADGSYPAWRILCLLAAKVGLPYFLLAATSPLVQSWFARLHPQRSVYRLYALSNIGSLGALLCYPVVIEPALTTAAQGWAWSVSYVVFAVVCGGLAWGVWRQPEPGNLRLSEPRAKAEPAAAGLPRPTRGDRVGWLLLPALASVMLMAVTNHLCQDVAVVPFLWIAPLSLYLLSFIICFDRDRWYVRRWFALAAAVALLAASYLPLAGYFGSFYGGAEAATAWSRFWKHVAVETVVYLVLLFLVSMVCHGELVRRKPAPRDLTLFYLTVAAGGALGGVLVAVVCPLLFSSFLELNLGVLISFLLALAVLVAEARRIWLANASRLSRAACVLAAWLMLSIVGAGQFESWDRERGLARMRNFYGVLSVKERFADEEQYRGLALFHGDTLHGFQLSAPQSRRQPTSYYTQTSGVGLTLRHLRPDGPLRVGAIGLGVGTIAAYGRPQDEYRFYEINPLVISVAQQYFDFLTHCQAAWDIVPGDARLSLETEPPQRFDVLVVDAFSGDTIPVHLLTREAMEIYRRHLGPQGVIAIHVSNRYVNLIPVVLELAHHFQMRCVLVRQAEADHFSVAPSDWMLLTHNGEFLDQPAIRQAATPRARRENFPLWTDQYNNLLRIFRTRMD